MTERLLQKQRKMKTMMNMFLLRWILLNHPPVMTEGRRRPKRTPLTLIFLLVHMAENVTG